MPEYTHHRTRHAHPPLFAVTRWQHTVTLCCRRRLVGRSVSPTVPVLQLWPVLLVWCCLPPLARPRTLLTTQLWTSVGRTCCCQRRSGAAARSASTLPSSTRCDVCFGTLCSLLSRPRDGAFNYKRGSPVDPRLSNVISDSALTLLRRATVMTSCSELELKARTPGVDDGKSTVLGDTEGAGIPIIVVTPAVAVALQKLCLDLDVWAAGAHLLLRSSFACSEASHRCRC
jgi:hypothetical protein